MQIYLLDRAFLRNDTNSKFKKSGNHRRFWFKLRNKKAHRMMG